MDLTVKWGKERIVIPFPDPSTSLGALKAILEERTSIPHAQFKLVHGGAILKDNNAPLSAYKLKPGSSLTLIGSTSSLPSKKDSNTRTGPDLRTESGMNAAIQVELANVEKTITPSLTSLLSTLGFAPQTSLPVSTSTSSTSQVPSPTPTLTPATTTQPTPASTASSNPTATTLVSTEVPPAETLRQTHVRLGELLLQSLLRLDALTPPSEWEETRRARKAAVKHVQGNLDALDTAWKGFVASGKLEEGGGMDKEKEKEGKGTGSVRGKGKGKRRR